MSIPFDSADRRRWLDHVLGRTEGGSVPASAFASALATSLGELRRRAEPAAALEFARGSLALGEAVLEAPEVEAAIAAPAHDALRARLRQTPLAVAFSPHTAVLDGTHVVAAHVAVIRPLLEEFGMPTPPLPSAPPLTEPLVQGSESQTTVEARLIEALATLERPLAAANAIHEIRSTLDLSMPELAAILGVSRQAIEQWRARGVPPERRADVDRLREGCAWLRSRLKAERIPSIARTPALALGGRTMLDLLGTGTPLDFLEYVAQMFAWQTGA